MPAVNVEVLRKFFANYGLAPESAAQAMKIIEPGLLNGIENGYLKVKPAGPAQKKNLESGNQALWRKYGYRFRCNVGDGIGTELRQALTSALGPETANAINDSLFLFLGFAAVGDTEAMNDLAPYVMALTKIHVANASP